MFETRNLSKLGKRVLNTKKRKAYLVVRDKHTLQPSYWSEGSRTLTYALIMPEMSLRSLSNVGLRVPKDSPFDQRREDTYGITENLGFVEVGHFCGEEATPTIFVNDAELVKDLFV